MTRMFTASLLISLATLAGCHKTAAPGELGSILVSTKECSATEFKGSETFVLWTVSAGNTASSEYTLYGQSLSLSGGAGIPQGFDNLYVAYPVESFDPETGKAYLPATADGRFPVSAYSGKSGARKLSLAPASNFMEIRLFNDDSPTTLFSVSVTTDVPICGVGQIAYYTDGRPYVSYQAGQGGKTVTVNMGQDGTAFGPGSPVVVKIPVPGCTTVGSITVDYRVSEGKRTEVLAVEPVSLGLGQTLSASVGRPENLFADARNTRPYSDVNWNSVKWINTTSHAHCEDDRTLGNLRKRNMEFFTLANYYPSAPTYPAGEMPDSRRGVPVTDYPVVVNGQLVYGPFDWNEIVSQWADKLPAEQQKQLPFAVSSGKMFPSWVEGTLEAPNAEHHSFKFDGKYFEMHMCCPGSSYASGTFDAHDKFGTVKNGGYNYGTGLHWKTAIDYMLKGLIIPSGGGVTINHPGWSVMTMDIIYQILDYDARVLGIEVLNTGDNDEDYWDNVLCTGRQCFGFFVPDHRAQDRVPSDVFGINVLLVQSRTVRDCLEAYRKGNFYGAIRGLGELFFTGISFDGTTLRASTDKEAFFEVISDGAVVYSTAGTSMSFAPSGVYARIRATAADGCGEILYSQPFIL